MGEINVKETKLGWRLAVLPVWQRLILFLLFFIAVYPIEMTYLLFLNLWRGISHFFECLWLDLKDESLPWWKTLRLLLNKF